jgi:hypothetical protein
MLINCFLALMLCIPNQTSFVYWENLTEKARYEVISSDKLYKDAIEYFNGHLTVSDNDRTFALLDSISTLPINEPLKRAFYFHLFNAICAKADGAVSEILGDYCQNMLLSDTEYVANYLMNNQGLTKLYASLLGYELYLTENVSSDMRYGFSGFKEMLNARLSQATYQDFLATFYKKIRATMDAMD